MIRTVMLGAVALLGGSAMVAYAGPQDDVKAAAQKLADSANFSWKTTIENAGGGGGGGGGGGRRGGFGGPSEGKTEKGGYTLLTIGSGDNARHIAMKGEKVAIETQDGWQTPEEMAQNNGGGGGRRGGGFRNMNRTPAAIADELVGRVKELSESDGAWKGDLTEDGAKALLTFGGRRGGNNAGNGPEISNAKGSATFWVKDGVLTKFSYHVSGTISTQNGDRDVDRTTTTEISDVGSTKVEIPDEAKKKLE